jgi:hypothetical protein
MEPSDLNWLAGLLEGEGCFSVQRYKGNRKPAPRITVSMVDEDVVNRVGALFGSSVSRADPPSRKGHQPQYVTALGAGRAAILMRELYPLMGARRKEKIERVLMETGR